MAPGGHTRRTDAIALVVLLSVVLLLFVTSPQISTGPSPPAGTHFLSNTNRDVVLYFQDCANVTVHWQVISGSEANFSVLYNRTPHGPVIQRCVGPPPSNSSCPPGGCPIGFGSVFRACIETGSGGWCSFNTGVSPVYFEFLLFSEWLVQTSNWSQIGFVVVAFTFTT